LAIATHLAVLVADDGGRHRAALSQETGGALGSVVELRCGLTCHRLADLGEPAIDRAVESGGLRNATVVGPAGVPVTVIRMVEVWR
jgi:hypothetical protein